MSLLKQGTDLQEGFGDVKDMNIDSPPEIFNRHELYEDIVQVDEDLGFYFDGCVVDNPKGRWNPNIYLIILNHLLWLPSFKRKIHYPFKWIQLNGNVKIG